MNIFDLKVVKFPHPSHHQRIDQALYRDQKARRQYFDVERFKRQRGDLYIMQIMDEEMKPNDPRLS